LTLRQVHPTIGGVDRTPARRDITAPEDLTAPADLAAPGGPTAPRELTAAGGLAAPQGPMAPRRGSRRARGALGLPLLLFALVGLGIAGYLLAVRLIGEPPVCGPSGGCELVQQSKYSVVFGIPVAAWGTAFSLVLAILAARWWLAADRQALTLAYLALLAGTIGVASLTYLELFVIHAVCAWCVSYAIAMVLSLVTTGLALRRS
jgi:uncharacterized membrane protein